MIILAILLLVPLIGCIIASRYSDELMEYERALQDDIDHSGLSEEEVRKVIRYTVIVSVVIFVLLWWAIIPMAMLRRM